MRTEFSNTPVKTRPNAAMWVPGAARWRRRTGAKNLGRLEYASKTPCLWTGRAALRPSRALARCLRPCAHACRAEAGHVRSPEIREDLMQGGRGQLHSVPGKHVDKSAWIGDVFLDHGGGGVGLYSEVAWVSHLRGFCLGWTQQLSRLSMAAKRKP